jgi:kinesin family protein 2/24
MNRKELNANDVDVTTIPDAEHTLIHECKAKVDLTKYLEHHQFRFDQSFDETVDNFTVYKYTAAPLVKTIFDKGFATCFAYGQTGSGKTHTMGGEFSEGAQTPDSVSGIYAFAAEDVFRFNAMPENIAKGLFISVSFFEIYGGKVFDLLNQQKRLRVLEDGKQNVNIVGLAEEVVTNIDDVLGLLGAGVQLRASGTTSANANSSRSHAVFQIVLRNNRTKRMHGKFSLIDLAGNERGADTSKADRQTRIEGAEINKSLLALKECIRALSMKSKHTPYRASKLTQVLRDSFIHKNARTCMIAMISPGLGSCENTLNTLRYADRVKELKKGKPVAKGGTAMERVQQQDVSGSGGDSDFEMDGDDGGWLGEPSPLEGSLAKQDLQHLHDSIIKRNGGKQSQAEEAAFQFHDAVAEVVEAEERVVEEHRAALQADQKFLAEEEKMLAGVQSAIDYDMDAYAKRLDEMLTEKIGKLQSLQGSVQSFRRQLTAEEHASKRVSGQLRF